MTTGDVAGVYKMPSAKVGCLKSLEIQDFKSYKGLHVIGPFANFTAVIGPNGSGKSNLMDAISFVCGVKTSHLRGKLEELLYSNQRSEDPKDHPDSGRVSLVFENTDGSTMHLTRSIVGSGDSEHRSYSSEYSIGKKRVSLEVFAAQLLELGINTKARNFLVFQGDIEKVAQQSPEELRVFFELISGSDALKGDYSSCEDDVNECERKSGVLHTKKQAVTKRKSSLEEAKREAEKYQKETRALVFHLRHDYVEAHTTKQEYEAAITDLRASHNADVAAADGADARLAALKKERTSAIRSLEELRRTRDQKNPAKLKAKEKLILTNRELARTQKGVADIDRKKAEVNTKLAGTVKDLKQLQAALSKIETGSNAVDGIEFTEELHQQYRELKEQADEETTTERAALAQERTVLDGVEGTVASLQEQVMEIQMQKQTVEGDLATREQQASDAKAALAEQQGIVEELEKQQADLHNRNRRNMAVRDRLRKELDEIEPRIACASAEYRSNKKEKRMAEALVKMKRQFPDQVLGRLVDIVKTKGSRNNVAIAVLMGRQMDSVVVRTFAAAKQCVALLKAERCEPMEFIPLDRIKAPMLNEGMRHLGPGVALGVDLVEYDPKIEPAVLFSMGNALVADSQAKAKDLGYGRGYKVTDREGTLISVNGSMSGGATRGFQDRARKFDQAAADRLVAERNDKQQQLDALPDEHHSHIEEQTLRRDVNNANLELNTRREALAAVKRQHGERKKNLANVVAALGEKEPELKRLEGELASLSVKAAELEKQINKRKDTIFKAFSKAAGVKNMREHEAKIVAKLRDVEDRTSKLRRQLAELHAEEDRCRTTLQEHDMKRERMQAAIKTLQEAAREAGKGVEAVTASTSGLDVAISEKEAALQSAKGRLEEVEERARGSKSSQKKFNAELQVKLREVERHERSMASCITAAKAVARDAMLVSVDLRASGAAQRQARGSDGDEQEEEEEEGGASMDLDKETQEGSPASRAEDDDELVPKELRGDFMGLSTQLRRSLDDAARTRKEAELEEKISDVAQRLEDTVPNLKAPEEFKLVQAELAALHGEELKAKKELQKAQRDFTDVREQRAAIFHEAFDHVSAKINDIYKSLTMSSTQPHGGDANLHAMNGELPFTGGVKFSVIPPGKRYGGIETLSGGEKTLAALALLLAVHTYKPSPFFVFDEVDAALDATNLHRIANYMRRSTRDSCENAAQGIVISLKDVVYQKADALVGVTKNVHGNASSVFTMDLERFGLPQD